MAITGDIRATLRDLVKGGTERAKVRSGGVRDHPRFVIYGRGRSGSTLLTSLLTSAPGVHCDGEILHNRCRFPLRRVYALSARHPKEAYGCKVLSYQLRDVQAVPDAGAFLRDLHAAGFKMIYLRRDNLVSHAVSNLRARTYGFHKRKGEALAHDKLAIDPADLIAWMEASESLFAYEQQSLEDMPHLPLVYEQDLHDPASRSETMRKISNFLGMDIGAVSSDLAKVSPERLADSVGNYDAIADSLRGTRFERYLADA